MSMTTAVFGLTLQTVPGCPKGAANAGPKLSLPAAVERTSPCHNPIYATTRDSLKID